MILELLQLTVHGAVKISCSKRHAPTQLTLTIALESRRSRTPNSNKPFPLVPEAVRTIRIAMLLNDVLLEHAEMHLIPETDDPRKAAMRDPGSTMHTQ